METSNSEIHVQQKKRRRKKRLKSIATYFILVVFSIFMFFPFYWMLISSLKSSAELVEKPPSFFPHHIALENYEEVFKSVPIGRYMLNSVIIALCSMISTAYTSITGAFALTHLNIRGKNIILAIMVSLMMVPYELLIISNYSTIVKLGLNDTLMGLFLPFMSSIFYTLLFRNYFNSISDSLYKAAKIDNSSDWKFLWRILFPLSKPMLSTVMIFNAISSWNSFIWPLLIIKSQDNRTITFGVYAFVTDGGEHFELMMALSIISLIPMVLLFLVMRKRMVRSVSFNGIKG